jgi:hypothetical protein
MIGIWHLADIDATTGDANDPIEIDDKEEVIDVDEVRGGRDWKLASFHC